MNKSGKQQKKSKVSSSGTAVLEKSVLSPWLPLFLACVALLVYSNTLKNGFVLDDNSAIQNNFIVQKGASAIPEILRTEYRAGYWSASGNLYRPLSLTVFAVLWDLSPGDPFPGHLVNFLLYALTAVLLFYFMARLTDSKNGLFPFLVALLYTVHPLHTEVVANIKSLDEILSLLFLLLAGISLMSHQRTGGKRNLLLAAGYYFLALLSKESAITFLAVFPLITYYLPSAEKRPYGSVLTATLVPAVIYLLIRGTVLGAQKGEPYHLLLIDNSLVGAKDFMEKSASAFVLLGKYLWMQIWPHPLSIDYSYDQIPLVRWNDPLALLSLGTYLSLAATVVYRLRKKEWWVFGIAVFLITISLYSNLLLTIGTNFGERLAYLPSLGACIALISGLSILTSKKPLMPESGFSSALKSNLLLTGLVTVAALAGARYSHARNTDWKDYFSIYEADVRKAPKSARLNYWYGMELMKVKGVKEQDPAKKRQYYDTAMVYMNKALAIHPDYGDAYAQRGLLNFRLGNMQAAEADYKEAASRKVAQWGMYSNLAILYAQRMDMEQDPLRKQQLFDEAMKNLGYALQVDRRPATIYKNMAGLYHSQRRFPEAIAKYKEALDHITAEYEQLVPEINVCLEECYRMIGDSANAQYYRSR
ncbi:MAG: hypothetical protein RL021_1997 [Bacteroidota bacterium]|jgi:tetratricopeptide (TPR) repeat protein